MSDPRASHRAVLRAAMVALLGGMLAAVAIGPAEAASTSLGSVPAEVAAYVANGGMVARLNDVYGKNAARAGIDFDATTKEGPISRVYEWTAQRLSNVATDHPVQLTNNWVVPITIADKPVGVATIWINPQTVAPELASFDPTPGLALALDAVPATAALVRDTAAHAWLALDAGTVTPLIAGSSGLSTPVPVDSVKLSAGAAPPRQPVAGLVLVIIGVAALVVVLMVALLLPRGRFVRKRTDRDAAAPEPGPTSPATHPASATKAVSPAKSGAAAKSSTPVTKPTSSKPGGSKPGGGTPASSTASTKPRAQKPPVQKPPVQKPPVQKPPVQKRQAPRPLLEPDPDPTPDA